MFTNIQLDEFAEAVADLELKLKMFGDPKTGAVTKSQAETAANETDLHFEVIDGVTVTVDGDQVVIKGDVGVGAPKKMASKPWAKGIEAEAEGGKASSTIDEPLNAVKTEEGFSMSGHPHTLYSEYKDGKLTIKMASNNPKEILEKIEVEIGKLKYLPMPTIEDKKKLGKLQSLQIGVDGAIKKADFDSDAVRTELQGTSQATQIPTRIKAVNDSLLDNLKTMIVGFGNEFADLTDIEFQAFNLEPTMAPIRNQINDQLEKHILRTDLAGDGHACSAYAAEKSLGWYVDQGSSKPQLHKEKISVAKREIEVNIDQWKDLVENHDSKNLKTDPVFPDKKGQKISYYDKAIDAIDKCNLALSNPAGYLASSGQTQEFQGNIDHRNHHNKTQVDFIKSNFGHELGNPATVHP